MFRKLAAVLALILGVTLLSAIPSPASAALPYGSLAVYEHHYPTLGTRYQFKYQYTDCDSVGYRYTATYPLFSSSITYFPASTTPKCNSLWIQNNNGNTYEQCTNARVNPVLNFGPAFNDNLRQFGIRYRSGCALNR